jgi:hypothetical protein
MRKRLELLIQRAEQIARDDTPRRRVELVERTISAGHSREYADQIYDLAEEEGISPPTDDGWEESQVEAPPEWVAADDLTPDAAARERHMRATFRRLRRMFEQHGNPTAALEAFAAEPDVDEVAY